MAEKLDIPKKGYVDILTYKNGEHERRVRVFLDGDSVRFEGDDNMIEELKNGIVRPLDRERVTPEDGYLFLSTLSDVFDGPGTIATNIKEGEPEE